MVQSLLPLLFAVFCLFASHAQAAPLKVYILAGQSNMEGHAAVRTFDHLGMDPKTAPLLEKMRNADGTPHVCDKVWISYLTTKGVKQGKLTTDFGALGSQPKIGPEFTFGITLEEKLKEPILLIKTAWGGKSLYADFRPPSAATSDKPTGEYYTLMADHVRKVLANIKAVYPGYDPKQGYELAGFVWFQGWNDMTASNVYPNRGKLGGYDMYSDLLAKFIRDVRKDFNAPKMPFVIGVMGTGGPVDPRNPGRHGATTQSFRMAMAAPANLPEFKGNVIPVFTEKYWDKQLGELANRMDKVNAKSKELSKDPSLTKEQREAAVAKLKSEMFTPEELKIHEVGVSNFGFHYLGSGKVMAQIGVGFAKALLDK